MAWQGAGPRPSDIALADSARQHAARADQLARAALAAVVLSDLDRCEHGRHEGDVCSGCGGPSLGNPFMAGDPDRLDRQPYVPRQIGYDLSGNPIVVPEAIADRHHPEAWRAVQP